MFGEQKIAFDADILRDLIVGKREGLEIAENYVLDYFAKVSNPPGVIMWIPSEKKTEHFKDADIKNLFIKKIPHLFFNVQKWFFEENTTVYRQNINLKQSRIYEIQGQKYLNLFEGFKYIEVKEYKSFDDETKRRVDFIWKHIFIAWASRKKETFDYMKQWICNMMSGIKMRTYIYLKGEQGTGKSIVTEFFQKTLGLHAVYVTSSPDVVIGGFNSQIANKMLLVLEEMPCHTAAAWMSLSNSLKQLITGQTITIKQKYKDEYETDNTLSVIVISNNNAVKLEPDCRRSLVGDISNELKNNYKYFDELGEYMDDETVQEAFYWYCRENVNPKFNENRLPVTESKKALVIESLPTTAQFLKTFLIKRESIKGKFTDFYQDFRSFCKLKVIRDQSIPSNQNVGVFLKNLGFEAQRGTGNKRYVNIEYEELLQKFREKNWINDYDDIEEEEPPKEYKITKEELKEMKKIHENRLKEYEESQKRFVTFCEMDKKYQKMQKKEEEKPKKLILSMFGDTDDEKENDEYKSEDDEYISDCESISSVTQEVIALLN